MPPRIYRLRDVLRATGFARSTLYLKVSEGKFPAPFKSPEGPRGNLWDASEVDRHIAGIISKGKGASPRRLERSNVTVSRGVPSS